MDNYSYHYQKYPENYQLFTNSIPDFQQENYINNTITNPYQFYAINTYDREKLIQKDYDNRIYPQALFYRNDINLLSIENEEDFGVSYSKDINKNIIQKAPKDAYKIPKDNVKNKTFYKNIDNNSIIKSDNNNNYNNITTINNNNYNKINSINIIFDANNIYNNNEYIKFNNYKEISFMENSYNKNIENGGMNINADENKNEMNIEKQPKDNYKKYSDSLQMNNCNFIKNNTLIRLKKNEIKEKPLKDNSLPINNTKIINQINNQNDFPKNKEVNKKNIKINDTNININKTINNKTETTKIEETKKKEIKLINKNIEFNNKKPIEKNSIQKIEKINNNDNYITNIKITENNKRLTSPKSHKKINQIYNTQRPNNNNEKQKKSEKMNKTKHLKQTKSYIHKNTHFSLQRRNTYQNELNKNSSFNSTFIRNKSKEKENSFAFLINKKKRKMFSSFKHINAYNRLSHKEITNKYLTAQKNDIIYEKKRKSRVEDKYRHRTNILERNEKSDKTTKKESNNQIKYKRLYTPQLSSNYIIKNKAKEIISEKEKEKEKKYKKKYLYNKNKNNQIIRNISYNESFNNKKNRLFKKKVDLSTPKIHTNQASRNETNIRFKTKQMEDSFQKSNLNEKIGSNNILRTENIEELLLINPLFVKKVEALNKSDKNLLELSHKNAQKTFNQKTTDIHLKKKNNNLKENKNNTNLISTSRKIIKNNKNLNISNKSTIKKNNISKTHTAVKSSCERKIKHNINNKTERLTKKRFTYSKNKDRDSSGIINQKKHLYSFTKKKQRKSFRKYNVFSEEKKDMYNTSFRGFSAFKKLEEIKKKYKFRPQTKEKKINLKERNINYIEESKGFARLISSANLFEIEQNSEEIKNKLKKNNNDNNNKESNSKDININDNNNSNDISDRLKDNKDIDIKDNDKNIKDINNNNKDNNNIKDTNNIKDNSNCSKDNSNYTKDEENKENENDNDIINNKSFILDLNNVIPINDKELLNTVNKVSRSNDIIERNNDINKLSLINENKEIQSINEENNNKDKSIEKSMDGIDIKKE